MTPWRLQCTTHPTLLMKGIYIIRYSNAVGVTAGEVLPFALSPATVGIFAANSETLMDNSALSMGNSATSVSNSAILMTAMVMIMTRSGNCMTPSGNGMTVLGVGVTALAAVTMVMAGS